LSVGQDYHRLPVIDVIDETPDAKSFVLRVDPRLARLFAYRPGQFLTVRVPHNGCGAIARCYSLSSSPYTERDLRITVKRVPDGHGSNWLCDHLAPGAELELLPPAGTFTPGQLDSDLLLLAGGSGITPVMSILKAALCEGRGHLALVYANRDEPSVIFAAELRRLAGEYPHRLTVHHRLDAVHGPPTVDSLATVLRRYAGRDAYVCGPQPYMDVACQALRALGVPAHRVHLERFQLPEAEPPAPAGPPPPVAERDATVEVTLDGVTRRLPWPAGTRLLDVILDAGLNPPYSCRQGSCGACACRLLAGEVHLVHNEVLEEEDFADGYILACQALARTETVAVTYQ
jgi:3-ketosteroid 9alpha-monooxygenase subunit B